MIPWNDKMLLTSENLWWVRDAHQSHSSKVLSSAGLGKENITRGLWVKIRARKRPLTSYLISKTNLAWGIYLFIINHVR